MKKVCRYCPRSAVCAADGCWPWRLFETNGNGDPVVLRCEAGTPLSGGPMPAVFFEAPKEVWHVHLKVHGSSV